MSDAEDDYYGNGWQKEMPGFINGNGKRVYITALPKEAKNMSIDPEFLRREAQRMLARAEALEKVPQQDIFEDGQVITFTKTFSGDDIEYNYAAIRANGRWYNTSTKTRTQCLSWTELLDFIQVHNLESIFVVHKGEPIADYWAQRQTPEPQEVVEPLPARRSRLSDKEDD
jgi:hypothetical protein